MSQYAKSIVAALGAVLLSGVTSWQTVTAGAPFRPVDALPIACTVVGAALTYVVPNVPQLPAAKGIVSAVLAALTAASTVLVGNNTHVDVAAAVVAGLTALLTWYVPNLPAAAAVAGVATKAATGRPVGLPDVADALRQLEQLAPPPTAPAPPARQSITDGLRALDALNGDQAPAGPLTSEIPAQTGKPPTSAAVAVEPTPIADAALAAAQTVVLPAVTG